MFRVKNTRKNTKRPQSPTTVQLEPSHTLDKQYASIFDAELISAGQKPWLRLERGIRLQKFRQFAEEYPGITEEEKETLYRSLVKANDSKLLNSKQQIQYEDNKIHSIRCLKMTRVGDAPATFKIEVARPTKRRSSKEEDALAKNDGSSV